MNNPGGGNTAENYSYRKWQQTLRQLEAAEKRLQRMQEQRDKLLAACGLALEAICAGAEDWMLSDVEVRLRAAIAAIKEAKSDD